MSEIITSVSEVPEAICYVVAQDKFFSGWGLARNKRNICIWPCDSWEQAEVVERNAQYHGSMIRIRINKNPPRFKSDCVYSLFDKEHAKAWYRKGSFRGV